MTAAGPEDIARIWADFCDQLKAVGSALDRPTTPADEVTLAEGLRYLSRITRIALESALEHGDPLRPSINQLVSETKKFGCDNPDTLYQTAALRGDLEYRISGRRGTVNYLSFITSSGPQGASSRDGFLDSQHLAVDGEGNFSILLSSREQPGNWLKMAAGTNLLAIRQTFLDRASEEPATLGIHCLTPDVAAPQLSLDQVASQLRAALGFAGYCATTFTDWSESYLGHVNQLPPANQALLIAAGLDPNIFFYRSIWRVLPEEALVVHIPAVPPCETWNIQVDNYWQESMDYRVVRSHLNKATAHYNADGSVTAVIAHRDPGHPNWLNAAGHITGHLGMRYVGAGAAAEQAPARPITRLCPLVDLPQTLCELAKHHDS